MRPVAFCSSRPPDVPGAYNINSSSGCLLPGSVCPGVTFLRPGVLGVVRRTLPSNHTPSANPLPPAVPDAPWLACCLPRRITIPNPALPVTPSSIPWYSTPSELRPHSPSQSTCHPERSHTLPFLPYPADILPLLFFHPLLQQKLIDASWASSASDARDARDVNWRSGCRLTPRLRCDETHLPTKSSGSTRKHLMQHQIFRKIYYYLRRIHQGSPLYWSLT